MAIKFENGLIRSPNFIDVVGSSLTFFKKHSANSILRSGSHSCKVALIEVCMASCQELQQFENTPLAFFKFHCNASR